MCIDAHSRKLQQKWDKSFSATVLGLMIHCFMQQCWYYVQLLLLALVLAKNKENIKNPFESQRLAPPVEPL